MPKNHLPRRGRYGIFAAMFLFGALLMLVPIGYSLHLDHQQNRLASAYLRHPQTPSPLKEAIEWNADLFAKQQGKREPFHQTLKPIVPHFNKPIGLVRVPAIGIKGDPIYFSSTDAHLDKGPATMDGTSLPVGGKNTLAVVTGHSGLANRIIFDNIRYLKRGDIFYFTALRQKEIAYQVDQIKVVDPDQPEAAKVVNAVPGKDRAALLTCTPLFINTHRLVVFGHRIPIRQAQARATMRRDFFTPMHIWLIAVGLLMLIFTSWFIVTEWREWRTRRTAKKNERGNHA